MAGRFFYLPAFYMNNYSNNQQYGPAIRKQEVNFPTETPGFNVTPGMVVGALVGGSVLKKQMDKNNARVTTNAIRNEMMNMPKPIVDGNYYNQSANIVNNLNIVFTPMSVVFVVKNQKQNFTLDTIETSEMNEDMKQAWKMKDENYFKGLMLSKMYTEMQLAEQSFAKSFLKKQIGVRDMINKDASDTSFIDEMNEVDTFDSFFKNAAFFAGDELKEKIATSIIDDIENEDSYFVSLSLDRPIKKYAGFISGIKSSLGFGSDYENIKTIKKHMANPSYVVKNIKVGFFPDRVVYSMDNQLIGTMHLTDMNEDGYNHFQKQDALYFKDFFSNSIKKNIVTSPEIFMSNKIEKKAGADFSEAFLSSETHPVILYLIMVEKFGIEWLTYDIAIIERIVKTGFNIEDIPETVLNKIISILVVNQSNNPFTNAYAFEKILLSFCSKPIDFFRNEKESISIQDVVFTIDIMDRVTPFDDIYDNFSGEVLNYISDTLSQKELYLYAPTNIISSPMEPAFNELLNGKLLEMNKLKLSNEADTDREKSVVIERCDYVAKTSKIALDNIREFLNDREKSEQFVLKYGLSNVISHMVSKICNRESEKFIIENQVVTNIGLDSILSSHESRLEYQLDFYNLVKMKEEYK